MNEIRQTGIDLSWYSDVVPHIGMEEPAIINWKMMPPCYGWSVPVVFSGVTEWFDGSPDQIVNMIDLALSSHNPGRSLPPRRVWDYCNLIWIHRDPQRSIFVRKGEDNPTIAQCNIHLVKKKPVQMLEKALEEVRDMLVGFDEEKWQQAHNELSRRFDPASKLSTSNYDIYLALTARKTEHPPSLVKDIDQADAWLMDTKGYVIDFLAKFGKLAHR